MNLAKFLLVFVLNILLETVISNKIPELGDKCTVAHSGQSGVCQFHDNCPSIKDSWNRQSIYPTLCDVFYNRKVFCCPENVSSSKADFVPVEKISVQKCREYNNLLYKNEDKGRNLKCPIALTQNVINGTNIDSREFSHIALVGYDNELKTDDIIWNCSGTLISERFVLTAAHCLNDSKHGPAKYILLGELGHVGATRFDIAERIKFPNYTAQHKYDDIGLLRLNSDVTFSEYIRPACLPEFNLSALFLTVKGLEKLNKQNPENELLQKFELQSNAYQDCKQFYEMNPEPSLNQGILNDTQLCVTSFTNNEEVCQSQSGVPLQEYNHKFGCMNTIVGVSLGGIQCSADAPMIYTRVYPYLVWIESIVWVEAGNETGFSRLSSTTPLSESYQADGFDDECALRCTDGTCVLQEQICDETEDCPNGADELNCRTCSEDKFECDNGLCIDLEQRCDGISDCADGSDETHSLCELINPTTTEADYNEYETTSSFDWNLQTTEFAETTEFDQTTSEIAIDLNSKPECALQCEDGYCAHGYQICDGMWHCSNGEDELNCPNCESNQWRCDNTSCINLEQKCDGISDCLDGSDEAPNLCEIINTNTNEANYIEYETTTPSDWNFKTTPSKFRFENCNRDQFQCEDGSCIKLERMCDGIKDCSEGKDEMHCYAENTDDMSETAYRYPGVKDVSKSFPGGYFVVSIFKWIRDYFQ